MPLHPIMPFISEELWIKLETLKSTRRKFLDVKFPDSINFEPRDSEVASYDRTQKFILEGKKN